MSLTKLLLDLQPLVSDPERNAARIRKLLDKHRGLAEYEVARCYVGEHLLPTLVKLVGSQDPRERRRAAEGLALVGTKDVAAKLLRPLVKDADLGVRSRARHAVRKLGLEDVALRDGRFEASEGIGGWNPTGWSFGLYAAPRPYPRQPPRSPPREAVLAQQGLPALKTVAELRALLGLEAEDDLRRLLRPGVGVGSAYVEFTIPKSGGGERRITAPRARLKRVQRSILRAILSKLPLPAECHGFAPRRSVVSNARPHEGALLVIKTDLRDFFPTIHYRRVQGLFESYGYGAEVAAALAGLCTHRARLADGWVVWPGVLPQGAPTSPALSNLLCRRLDARLKGLAESVGAVYTRYADDLTFSFAEEPTVPVGRFLWWVDQVCQQEGFIENTDKRRVLRASNQQRVTGVVVNQGLTVPRAARRRFRAVLANCRKHGLASQARGRRDFKGYLLGFASWVKMVQPALGQRLLLEVRELLKQEQAKGAPGG